MQLKSTLMLKLFGVLNTINTQARLSKLIGTFPIWET